MYLHFGRRYTPIQNILVSAFLMGVLLIDLETAYAEGFVAGQTMYYLPGSPTWIGATPEAVCVAHPNFCGYAPGTLVSNMTCGIVPGSAVGNPNFCNTYTMAIAPLLTCPSNSNPTGTSCTCDSGYMPDASASQCIAACPAYASPTGDPNTPCQCDTGYDWDTTHTSCESTCKITTKIAEVTDPVALLYEDGTYNSTDRPDLEHLTPATQTGLACIQQKVAALNCYKTPKATSGYRPAAYQTHIREVYDKWQLIKDDNSSECADVKASIKAAYDDHKYFARQPGATSNHSQLDALGNPAGNAVDISDVPDNALNSADAIACQCNMYRPLINMPNPKDNDPVHYQPRTCLP
jgi:hypothetical protein